MAGGHGVGMRAWGTVLITAACAGGDDAVPNDALRAPYALSGEPYALLGELSQPETQSLGSVRRITVVDDTVVVVADEINNRIALSFPPYRRLVPFGVSGAGPEEFGLVWDVAELNDGAVAVLDRRNSRISKWSVGGGTLDEPPAFLGSFNLDFSAFGVCSLQGELVVTGLWRGATIHVFDADGALLRSFGSVLHAQERQASGLTDGPLVCTDELVIHASELLPHVFMYSSSGELLREVTLPDFSQTELLVRGTAAGYRIPDDPGYVDWIASLVPLPDGRIWVTGGRTRPGEVQPGFTSWVIGTDSAAHGPPSNWVLRASGPFGFATSRDDPFPQIGFWR